MELELLITWRNVAFFLISSVVLGLFNQLQIFLQLYLKELLRLLTGLGLIELQHLIYARLLTGFGMLVFFTNLSVMEFQVRYFTLFLFSSVINSFEWFWMEVFTELHFWSYTFSANNNDLLDDVICDVASMLITLLFILSVITYPICGNNLNWLLNLNLIQKTLWIGARSDLLISMLGKLNLFRMTSLITLVLLI